jgi:protein SCO1/2
VSRYVLGIDYVPNDLKFSLIDSANGRIGTAVDKILLLCYHYDPMIGRYGLAISWLIKGAGITTIVLLGSFLWINFRREARMPKLTRSGG